MPETVSTIVSTPNSLATAPIASTGLIVAEGVSECTTERNLMPGLFSSAFLTSSGSMASL